MLWKIIDAHREFLQDIEIIKIPRIYLTHDKMEWRPETYSMVCELILDCNGTDADVGSNVSVNILYYINQEDKLPPFLTNLPQLLSDNIQFQALQLLYHYQGSLPVLLNKRRSSQFERDYLNQLKEEFDISNPQ